VEGVVILGSILLAFGIEAWWAEQQERAEEQLTLGALRTEFLQAKAELEYRLGFHRRIEGSVSSAVATLQRAREDGASSVSIPDTVLAWSYVPPTTQLSVATLDGLIQSGQLGILLDRELRNALSAWVHLLDEMTEGEVRSVDYVQSQLDPVLRNRVDVSRFVDTKLVRGLIDGNPPRADVNRESRMPADLETLGVFAVRLSIIEHVIEEFPPVQDEADRILRLIERSLWP
jgi:hypothetical protein